MKIIDLLNKIANGEEVPKKIKYDSKTYYIDDFEHFYINGDNNGLFEEIFYTYNDYDSLNEKVEIIEEDKKIEKLCMLYDNETDILIQQDIHTLENKINEIIDYLNKGDK